MTGEVLLERDVLGQAERLLDETEETVGVADEVIGLAFGDRSLRAGLGGSALGGTGGEEGSPLAELGSDLGEQHPGVLLLRTAPPVAKGGVGTGGEQRSGEAADFMQTGPRSPRQADARSGA